MGRGGCRVLPDTQDREAAARRQLQCLHRAHVMSRREQVREAEVRRMPLRSTAYARLKLLHPSLPNGTGTSFTTFAHEHQNHGCTFEQRWGGGEHQGELHVRPSSAHALFKIGELGAGK
jgi:hypothetical protein